MTELHISSGRITVAECKLLLDETSMVSLSEALRSPPGVSLISVSISRRMGMNKKVRGRRVVGDFKMRVMADGCPGFSFSMFKTNSW